MGTAFVVYVGIFRKLLVDGRLEEPVVGVAQFAEESGIVLGGVLVGLEVEATARNQPGHPLRTRYACTPVVSVLVAGNTHEVVVAPAFVGRFESHFVGDEGLDSVNLLSEVGGNLRIVGGQFGVVATVGLSRLAFALASSGSVGFLKKAIS